MEKWFVQAKKADFNQIAAKFKIDPVTARLIRNRDVITEEEIRHYLHGDINHLHNPKSMKDMQKAVQIVKEKIVAKQKIRIIGDYDIDGVNATYILLEGLRRCGAEVDYDIPDRIKDGYGINENIIQRAYDEGIDTIITCDNGIAAITQINYAKELGMTVVVTDHHDVPFIEEDGVKRYLQSNADAIINPKQEECKYSFEDICGATVAYKFIECLYEEYAVSMVELHKLIVYAAIATIGDVMDLKNENRIIVKEGLKRLKHMKNPGLNALIQANGIEPDNLSSYHIGFVIGPCINASGRLDTAKRALELLCTEDINEANRIAGDLKALNDSRKALTLKGVETAIQQVEMTALKEDKILVIYLPDCHESLAGIIAGRIRESYNKPVFVLTQGEDGVKGSGRSIESYNMFEEMTKCRDIFTKFGGHPMAAGLSLPEEKIEELKERLNQSTTLTEEDFIAKILIDTPMPLDYITENLITELSVLEPFGKGNNKPVFAEKEIKIIGAKILGKNKNVIKMQVLNKQGFCMEAMYFGSVELFEQYIAEKFGAEQLEALYMSRENKVVLSLTYYPTINSYGGKNSLQIVVQNFQ